MMRAKCALQCKSVQVYKVQLGFGSGRICGQHVQESARAAWLRARARRRGKAARAPRQPGTTPAACQPSAEWEADRPRQLPKGTPAPASLTQVAQHQPGAPPPQRCDAACWTRAARAPTPGAAALQAAACHKGVPRQQRRGRQASFELTTQCCAHATPAPAERHAPPQLAPKRGSHAEMRSNVPAADATGCFP